MHQSNVNIIIADLQTKFDQIQRKCSDKLFYTKLADYGKYLLDQKETQEVLSPLYDESKIDVSAYLKAAHEFLAQWNVLAKDLVEIAEREGMKDDNTDLRNVSISTIKNCLGVTEVTTRNKDIDYYFSPYQLLVSRFYLQKKEYLITEKHIDKDNHCSKLQLAYNSTNEIWDNFVQLREIKVWWAHYQIERLTYGVFDLKDTNKYFLEDNLIDRFYKEEFNQILGNQTSAFIFLDRNKFSNWINQLHKYLLPRLEALSNHSGGEISPNVKVFLEKKCWMENRTFNILLNGGDKIVIDFEPRSKSDNMFDVFTILFENWQKQPKDGLSYGSIKSQLVDKGHSIEKLSGSFLKTTVGNIRTKFKVKGLENIVLIKSTKKSKSYILEINLT